MLQDAFEQRAARNHHYSQSAFARDLGLGISQLNEILKGKKGLSSRNAMRVATALGLSEAERQRFCDLVESEHGRSRRARQRAAARLSRQDRAPPQPPAGPQLQGRTLDGIWWVVFRDTSAGPVPQGWSANEWTQLWTFEGNRFGIVASKGDGVAEHLSGTFQLDDGLLLLDPDREGARRSVGAGLRHYVEWQSDGKLRVRTPGAALPHALCERGEELRSVLHRLSPPLQPSSEHSAAPPAMGSMMR